MAESQCRPRVCVMVLCGLPASGKSSLTKLLAVTTDRSYPTFITIEYDRLLPADVEKHLIEEGSSTDTKNQSPWKQYRGYIYQFVDALVCHQKEGNLTSSTIERPQNVTPEIWTRFQGIVKDKLCNVYSASGDICVIIDDNMYYHSMRYPFYQLARKYSLGFCQLYVKCDVDEAIARNSRRDFPVSDDVIRAMAENFEAPDTINTWEKHSFAVAMHDTESQIRHDTHQLIQQALDSPVEPLEEVDEELVNQSREICSANFLYQSDQILRKLVSQEMTSAKNKNLEKSEMREFASKMQAKRKLVLDGLKSGHISIPLSVQAMVTDASKDPDSMVYEFVKVLFHSHQDVR